MARFLINRKEITGKSPGTLIYLGKRKVEKPRIRLIHYDLDSEAEVELDTLQECLQWISDKSVSWLNIDGLHDPGLIQEMGDMFHIHGLQLEDIVNTDQRPKMDETDDLLIIYLKMVDFNQEDRKLQSEQITLVLTRNILISLQESVGDYFDPVRERTGR
jgi:magnesium transporter